MRYLTFPDKLRASHLSEQSPSVAYLDSTFEEAVGLACEVRDYVAAGSNRNSEGQVGYGIRMTASCETLRMTARLSQVIAWFLVQKAVHNGEISREQASEARYRLGGQKVCAPGEESNDEELPSRLRELLDRTGSLYARVSRLDAMMNG